MSKQPNPLPKDPLADIDQLTTQLTAMAKERDVLQQELKNSLVSRVSMSVEISTLREQKSTIESDLHNAKTNYTLRHNQALVKEQENDDLKREIANERMQYSCFRREVVRLLLLQQFPDGVQNELMVTRARNRLLNCVEPERLTQESGFDCIAERPMSAEEIEQTEK